MGKIVKWVGFGLAAIVGLVIVGGAGLYFMGRSQLNRVRTVDVQTVNLPADEAGLARGKHLVTAVVGCMDCHGPDLAGEVFIDEPPIGRVVASNLTAGAGGVGGAYRPEDWVRLLRHGVRPNGRAVLPMMPATFYTNLSDEDLGAIIAYLQTVPPVDHQLPATAPAFAGTIILGVLSADTLPVQKIDHAAVRPARMEPAVSAEYGRYLASIGGCTECHGQNFAGGQLDPSSPIGPNLTPGGELGEWAEADFVNTMRNGITPAGRPLSPFMPWQTYKNMTDEELQALWLYLQELAPLPSNQL